MTVRFTSDEAEECIKRVRSVRGKERSNFCELVERAGLDPGKDLRFGTFSGVDFKDCNLDGYDFTGASLNGCSFYEAKIAGGTFAQCEYTFNEAPYTRARQGITTATDSEDAYVKQISTNLALPECFDKHIAPGVHFSDFAFAPMMQCVVFAQPGSKGLKMAIEAAENEVDGCQAAWEVMNSEGLKGLHEYASWLNKALGLGHYFQYKVIKSRPAVLESDKISYATFTNIEIDGGLTFLTMKPPQPQVASLPSTNQKRDVNVEDSETVETGILVRRMREAESDLPLDFDDR